MIAALILRLSSRKATRVLVLRSIQSNVVTMDNLRKAFVLPAASWISRVCSETPPQGDAGNPIISVLNIAFRIAVHQSMCSM